MQEPMIIRRNAFQVVGYTVEANLQEITEKQLDKKTIERLKANAANIQHYFARAYFFNHLVFIDSFRLPRVGTYFTLVHLCVVQFI